MEKAGYVGELPLAAAERARWASQRRAPVKTALYMVGLLTLSLIHI